jgi:hypothetical protein
LVSDIPVGDGKTITFFTVCDENAILQHVYITLCALKKGSINVNLQEITIERKRDRRKNVGGRRERVGNMGERVRGRKGR